MQVQLVCRRKRPAFCGQKKTVIVEMVIAIANADIESNTAIKFTQIVFHIRAVLDYEIDNIQIAMSCSCIVAVIESQ